MLIRTLSALAIAGIFVGPSHILLAQGRPGRDRGLVEMPASGMRSGFYLLGSLGAGSERCRFEAMGSTPGGPCGVLDASGNASYGPGDWRQAFTRPSFQLRVGGTVNQSWRVGAEVFGWSGDNGPETERLTTLLAVTQFYPARTSGLYLKGGLGYGWSAVDFQDGATLTETGFAFNLGAGIDIPLTRSVSIGPVVDMYQASFPKFGDPTYTERMLFGGVSITFQSGRRWR